MKHACQLQDAYNTRCVVVCSFLIAANVVVCSCDQNGLVYTGSEPADHVLIYFSVYTVCLKIRGVGILAENRMYIAGYLIEHR